VKDRHRPDDAGSVLDELFAQAEDIHVRARASLGRPPVLTRRAPEPVPVLQVQLEPERQPELPRVELPARPVAAIEGEWADLDGLLTRAADAAAGVRGADACLVRIFGDESPRTARGLSLEEAELHSIGPPPVGPRVRALAIGYEPEACSGGAWPIQVALAVPIVVDGETAGFLSIFSRSEDAVFDEQQGWELLTIAASVREGIEALRTPATTATERAAHPWFRTLVLGAAALACVAAPALMAMGVHSAVRVAAAIVLLVLAPGAAAAPLFGSRSAPLELGLVAGTSLGISALVAELTLWAGAWSPWWATAGLAAVSFTSIVPQLGSRWYTARVAA